MYTYQYIPQRKNQVASVYIMVSFIAGVCLMMASNRLPYSSVFQIVSIGILTVGVFLTTRYITRAFAYSIKKSGDGYDFAVNELQGKKTTVVCRIGTEEIVDFFKADEKGRLPSELKQKYGGIKQHYDYCRDMQPSDAYYIVTGSEDGETVIRISPDERLVTTIEALRPKSFAEE